MQSKDAETGITGWDELAVWTTDLAYRSEGSATTCPTTSLASPRQAASWIDDDALYISRPLLHQDCEWRDERERFRQIAQGTHQWKLCNARSFALEGAMGLNVPGRVSRKHYEAVLPDTEKCLKHRYTQ